MADLFIFCFLLFVIHLFLYSGSFIWFVFLSSGDKGEITIDLKHYAYRHAKGTLASSVGPDQTPRSSGV